MKRFIFSLSIFALLVGFTVGLNSKAVIAAEKSKVLIVLQAGTGNHEGSARAVHALLYAQELYEKGHAVRLMFDGAGTTWIEELTNPASEHMLKTQYEAFQKLGVTEIVCDYCAGAFGVHDALQTRQLPLDGAYQGHPSLAKWIEAGYQVLIL